MENVIQGQELRETRTGLSKGINQIVIVTYEKDLNEKHIVCNRFKKLNLNAFEEEFYKAGIFFLFSGIFPPEPGRSRELPVS